MSHGMVPSMPRTFRATPPLPDPIESRASRAVSVSPAAELSLTPQPSPPPSSLRSGCYLIGYTPTVSDPLAKYDGTLRVETSSERMVASGDLYARKFDLDAVDFFPGPEPQAGIPILPDRQLPLLPAGDTA